MILNFNFYERRWAFHCVPTGEKGGFPRSPKVCPINFLTKRKYHVIYLRNSQRNFTRNHQANREWTWRRMFLQKRDTSPRLKLNISGAIYETRVRTLRRFPHTLLGDPDKRQLFFCQRSQEYFIGKFTLYFKKKVSNLIRFEHWFLK